MNFSTKYLVYWAVVIGCAFLADVFDVFGKLNIDGSSFVYGLLLGFVIMKFAPPVADSGKEEKGEQ